jgi:signal peptidase I
MNFALLLFLLLMVTGAVALADRLWLARRRAEGEKEPWWVEYGKSFFPVILIVFVLRSFLVEPFKIPSGSMMPTLLVGDFILVNKFSYGVRIPVVNKKVFETGEVKRGDVVVFRYPADPSLDYIKRVIGLPGDKVAYKGKRLTINGELVQTQPAGAFTDGGLNRYPAFMEKIGEHSHVSMVVPSEPPVRLHEVRQFPHRDNCEYNDDGFSCTVPPGQYFMMGDNRDQSADSRYWGFVPDDHLKGRAFLVWLNLGDLKRVGNKID